MILDLVELGVASNAREAWLMRYCEATDFIIAAIERAEERRDPRDDGTRRRRRRSVEPVKMKSGGTHARGISELMGMPGML